MNLVVGQVLLLGLTFMPEFVLMREVVFDGDIRI